MSRWVSSFENHAFRSTWGELKEALNAEKVDDETVITSVTELARLKKVITYLDEMIATLDPELVPLSTWDSFHSQASQCLAQVSRYSNSRNIAYVQEANISTDNLLTYIRPYMIAPRSVGKVLQQALKTYAKTIDEQSLSFRDKLAALVEEINQYGIESKQFYADIEKTSISAEKFKITLFGKGEDDGIQGKVNILVQNLEQKDKLINEFYIQTLEGDGENPSTEEEIKHSKEAILADQRKIETLLEEVNNEVDDLKKFHITVFGKRSDDDEEKDGLSAELDFRIKELGEFELKQKTRYKALNEQIESLLPGATSAGLATAYQEMKSSFDKPIESASNLFFWAIGILTLASFLLAIEDVGAFYINFVKFDDWNTVLKGLVYKIPFYAPMLWLAFYASKRRSEYQRLQQEYAHKEALAKSYNSYKKQIEELDNDDKEMQKVLIMEAVHAIAHNASTTLDGKHGDKMPSHDLIEKSLRVFSKKEKS